MKSNGLLKWLMIPLALLLVFVGIKLFSGSHASTPAPSMADDRLTPAEMKALGIEGDTPRDTVATLVGEVKQLRNELQTALGDNKNQKAENDRLHQRESDIDQRIQGALGSERDRLRQDRDQVANDKQATQGLLQDLQRRLDGLDNKGSHADLPVGLGLEDGDGHGVGGGTLNWVEPQDAKSSRDKSHPSSGGSSATGGDFQFPSSFKPASDRAQKTLETVETVAETGSEPVGAVTAKPVYTVPSNSTLMGSIAMTALIGRVPIDGTVNDPYPFKVLIGADNLTANGIDIPDVAGAVVSGTASGDWTLSCVRGQIRSITFVFHDGTIRTVPKDGGNASSGASALQNGANSLTLGGVGWIISGNQAMGRILAGGVEQMSQWVNKLYGQAFAAVYVQPGATVAVHIERPLDIDYDPKGRKVKQYTGDIHVADLD